MFTTHFYYTIDALKLPRSIIKQYFTLLNISSKEVPTNISHPSTVNKIDGYMDASISPSSVKIYN